MIKEIGASKSGSLSKNSSNSERDFQKALIENFVSLQHVLTGLSEKFDKLTKRLDGMIDLFEEASKTVVKGELSSIDETKHTEKVLDKMDKLFEQNKLIARGLTLMNEFKSGEMSGSFDSSLNSEEPKKFVPKPRVPLNIPKKPEPKKPEPLKKDEFGVDIPVPTGTRRVFEENSGENSQVNVPSSPPFKEL